MSLPQITYQVKSSNLKEVKIKFNSKYVRITSAEVSHSNPKVKSWHPSQMQTTTKCGNISSLVFTRL